MARSSAHQWTAVMRRMASRIGSVPAHTVRRTYPSPPGRSHVRGWPGRRRPPAASWRSLRWPCRRRNRRASRACCTPSTRSGTRCRTPSRPVPGGTTAGERSRSRSRCTRRRRRSRCHAVTRTAPARRISPKWPAQPWGCWGNRPRRAWPAVRCRPGWRPGPAGIRCSPAAVRAPPPPRRTEPTSVHRVGRIGHQHHVARFRVGHRQVRHRLLAARRGQDFGIRSEAEAEAAAEMSGGRLAHRLRAGVRRIPVGRRIPDGLAHGLADVRRGRQITAGGQRRTFPGCSIPGVPSRAGAKGASACMISLVPLCDRLGEHAGPEKGDLAGPNPVDQGKYGSKIHLIAERTGLPLSVGSQGQTCTTARL